MFRAVSESSNTDNGKNSKTIAIHDEDDIRFDNDGNMANYCNKYFNEVGVKMAAQIKRTANDYKNRYPTSMFLYPATENEIIQHINSLKNNSSPGIDGITTKMIKLIHPNIMAPLLHVKSCKSTQHNETGIVPDNFKTSIITPVYKNGNATEIYNYGPISIIGNFSKIFEKCLKVRLNDHLNKHQILHKNQFGFRESKITSDAMFEIVNSIKNGLEKNNKCIAVFLDLAKAFDTVPHNRLLEVLEHYGIRGVVLEVFKNYLNNRKQIVGIRDSLSEPLNTQLGIPQGTVLGPLLFIVYINYLLCLNTSKSTISYADDTVLIFEEDSWGGVKEKALEGVQKVKEWLDLNQLSLNVEKTKYIAFSITNYNRPNYNNLNLRNSTDLIMKCDNIRAVARG